MMAVTTAPARIPNTGLWPRTTNIFTNPSYSLNGPTASDIVVMPMNRSPKPITMLEISLVERLFPVSITITPAITATGASFDGLKNSAHSTEDTSHPVTVVPMLAPMITPMAWVRFISPAFTNPTTMTVVADEL